MMSGGPASTRLDYIYENDVALGRLIDYLEQTKDPRRPSKKLIENTIIIFTSDNGAEVKTKTATGPIRSNKGSCYEGGHRVPFIVAWPNGKVGNGKTSSQLIGLQDLYATFSEILKVPLPDLRKGEKGAEDSFSILSAWRGKIIPNRPMFYNDHKESKDGAACAMRLDNPKVAGKTIKGQWKIFFDASLLRKAKANPIELYDLATDPMEANNRLEDPELKPLIKKLISTAIQHRTVGGHRFIAIAPRKRITFDWTQPMPVPAPLTLSISGKGGLPTQKPDGLGIEGKGSSRIDSGEGIALRFEQDVLIESIGIKAGNGSCGGSVIKGKHSPLAIYCIDADNDSNDQQGVISDLGIIKKGERLILDAGPHLGVEQPGSWKLQNLVVRPFAQD
jgi:hypothetical protein